VVEVNVGGEVIRNLEEPVEPVPGQDVYLTIDSRLQTAAREALIYNLDFWNAWLGKVISSSGVVVAMDAKTGEILALVSYPNYENNRMSSYIPGYYYEQLSVDEAKPLVNKAISAELPPGSVYKLVSALGVLNEGVVTPEQTVDDPGVITLKEKILESDIGYDRNYYCWDERGHGPVDFLHGIAYSCNVYWYKVGGGYPGEVENGGLGIWRMSTYARALGYGEVTGIELPGEVDGLVPDPTYKRLNLGENWATGDTYLAAVGQGYVLATPVQVMNSIATIANGGEHMQLGLISKVVAADGSVTQQFEPKVLWDITKDPVITEYDGSVPTGNMKTVQPWVIELAKRGMEMVVETGGTAYEEFIGDTNKVAGKTGTAEYCDDWANAQGLCVPGNWPAHAWFVGYAPYDDPEIVVVAFAYNGKEGALFSAPIVRKVIDTYFQLKEIDAALQVPAIGE
jgi:penicillin-binding protein 2